jgi:FKBP-type peptidyl-prolyl cis-trans isomerase
MKKILFGLVISIIMISSCSLNSFSQNNKKDKNKVDSKHTKIELKNYTDTISYIIGSDIGKNLEKNMIMINQDVFIKAFAEGKDNKDTLFTEEQKQAIMNKLQQELQKKQQAKLTVEAEINKGEGKKFLDDNQKKEGVTSLPSGLQYRIIKAGTGPKPIATDKVTVNYEGKLLNGKIFDSSYERKEPATFPLNGVIKGWTEGVQLMNTGSIYEFFIPSDLGYGDRGTQGIPPGSTLIFKVELISIEGK